MRCTTCGEDLREHEARCPTCGAVVPVGVRRSSGVRNRGYAVPSSVLQCARCRYHGQGIPYFSRPGHVGLLVGVSVFTYGIGGLAYWLARRNHYICPNCGESWDRAGAPGTVAVAFRDSDRGSSGKGLPSGGVKRRFLGAAIVLFASLLFMIGIAEGEVAGLIIGSVLGAAGSGTFFWGWKGLQDRRQALQTSLQREVLRLATRRRGRLTVTDVAAELNLSLPAAEKVLHTMDDGFRVRSDITDAGIIVYEFPEVQLGHELGPG